MDQLYKEVLAFQRRCRDYLDEPSASLARSLTNEVQKLEDEVQVKKNARSVENRVKSVARILEDMRGGSEMSVSHVSELIRQCEDFQSVLRRM